MHSQVKFIYIYIHIYVFSSLLQGFISVAICVYFLCIPMHVLSQSVWVLGYGMVKYCGGLAGDRTQLVAGKRHGVSTHNLPKS